MANLVRWNPSRDLLTFRNEMNRLFEQAFEDMPLTRWQSAHNWSVDVDVSETDDTFLVTASIPGVDPDDIDITISDNVLTLKGEFKKDETIDEDKYHLRERQYGSFSRSLTLPVAVDADAVNASYEKGILTLEIPKADEVKPRRIPIHTNGHKKIEATVE